MASKWRAAHSILASSTPCSCAFAQGIEVHLAGQLSIIPLNLCEARRSNGIERIEIDLAAFERGSIYSGLFHLDICLYRAILRLELSQLVSSLLKHSVV